MKKILFTLAFILSFSGFSAASEHTVKLNINGVGRISGTITSDGSTAIVGASTYFTDWLPGDQIEVEADSDDWYTISAITDNTHLTCTGNVASHTDVVFNAKHIDYPVRLDVMYNKSVNAIETSFSETDPVIQPLYNERSEQSIGTDLISGANNIGQNYMFMSKWTSDYTFTATRVWLYVRSTQAGKDMIAGIYEDDGGSPTNLLACTASTEITSAGWVPIILTSSTPILAGATYWICAMEEDSTGVVAQSVATGITKYKARTYDDTLPDPAGTGYSDYTASNLLAYVDEHRTLGVNTVSGSTTASADYTYITKWVSPCNMDISFIHLYISTKSSTDKLIAGIYADSAGSPGALLAETAPEYIKMTGWMSVPLISSLSLTIATPYWIVINSEAEAVKTISETCVTKYKSSAYDGTLPDPAGTGYSDSTSFHACAYADEGYKDFWAVIPGPVFYYEDEYVQLYNGEGTGNQDIHVMSATSPDLEDGGTWTKSGEDFFPYINCLAFATDWYQVGDTYNLMLSVTPPANDCHAVFVGESRYIVSATDPTDPDSFVFTSSMVDNIETGGDYYSNSILKDVAEGVVQVGGYYYVTMTKFWAPGGAYSTSNVAGTVLYKSTTLDSTTDSYTGTSDTVQYAYGSNQAAQTFTASDDYTITHAFIRMSRVGNPAGDVTVSIQDLSSGKPDGTDLAASIHPASGMYSWITTTEKIIPFQFHDGESSDFTNLTNGHKYAIVVTCPDGDSDNYINVGYVASGTYSGGGLETSSDGGSTWTTEDVNKDMVFKTMRQHWEYVDLIIDPTDNNRLDSWGAYLSYDPQFRKWGDQYLIIFGATGLLFGTSCGGPPGFAFSDTIDSGWELSKQPFIMPTNSQGMGTTRNYILNNGKFYIYSAVATNSSCNPDYMDIRCFISDEMQYFSCNKECRTDFADLRFYKTPSKATAFPYFIEDQTNSDSASIWINVDEIYPVGTYNTVYINYGDSGNTTTTSSGSDTFSFFDGFDDASIDGAKWGSAAGTVTETGGRMVVGGSVGENDIPTYATYPAGMAFRTKASRYLEYDDTWNLLMQKNTGSPDGNYYMDMGGGVNGGTAYGMIFQATIGGVSTSYPSQYTFRRDDSTDWICEIKRDLNGIATASTNNHIETVLDVSFTDNASLYLRTYNAASANPVISYDWAAIRKSLPEEPTWETLSLSSNAVFFGVNF